MNHSATYSPEDDKLRLYPAARLDADEYARAKAAGLRWAPMQKLFYVVWNPAAEDLLIEWCGEIEDEDKSLVERAEERADRFEDYSDSRRQDSERAHQAVKSIADNIPLGQPILVGHHSERHARKDAERIENGMRKAVNCWKQSEYWKQRAAGALSHAKYKELPAVRARRIKTLEAELRQQISRYTPLVTRDRPEPMYVMQQKWSECYPLDREITREEREAVPEKPHVWTGPPGRGGHWVAVEDLPKIKAGCARYEEHLMQRLEYEHAMLEEQGATELLARKPKSAAAQLPLCNYRAPEGLDIPNRYQRGEMIHYAQVEMPQAEYAKIYADYKGTMVVGNSHRVRTAVIKHAHVCVFLTDSKQHTPPAPSEPPKPKEPTREEVEKQIEVMKARQERREEETAAAAPFVALEQALKTGVQVVSAPQLFPTPPAVAEHLVELADIEPGSQVLEPSAGTGELVSAIYCNGATNHVDVVAIEINYKLVEAMRARFPGLDWMCQDFLSLQPADIVGRRPFDRVVMNPPFQNASDIRHIEHAMKFLKPGGRLVAICANGPRQQAKLKPIADHWEELPEGSFKESGTMVHAAIMVYNAPKAEKGRLF